MTESRQHPPLTFLRKLCHDLPPERVQEAEDRFWSYLDTLRAIVDRQNEQSSEQANDIPSNDSTDQQHDLTIPSR